MKNADFVAVVLPSVPTPPRVIYEAGVAAGLGKPVLVLSAGRMDLPFDVGAINVVRLEGANTRAVEMHLEAFLSTLPQRRRARQIHSQKPSSQREEAHAFAWAHRELVELKEARGSLHGRSQRSNTANDFVRLGFRLEDLVINLFRKAGYATTPSPGPDYGIDLAVSSAEVQRDLGGPLLVEIKSRLAPNAVRDVVRDISKLIALGRGSFGLVITLDDRGAFEEVALQQPLILTLSADRLIQLLEKDTLVSTIAAARDRQLSPDL